MRIKLTVWIAVLLFDYACLRLVGWSVILGLVRYWQHRGYYFSVSRYLFQIERLTR